MAEMKTDAATLRAEAGNFDSINSELQGVIGRVEGAGTNLLAVWQGQASGAAAQALDRFKEKASAQRALLEEISKNINEAGIQYSSADEDQAGSLSSQMNF